MASGHSALLTHLPCGFLHAPAEKSSARLRNNLTSAVHILSIVIAVSYVLQSTICCEYANVKKLLALPLALDFRFHDIALHAQTHGGQRASVSQSNI